MNITLLAIGKIKPHMPEHHLIKEWQKRIPWNITVKEIAPSMCSQTSQQIQEEGQKLLKSLPKESSYIIALEEKGKSVTSKEFADHLGHLRTLHSHLTFIIGGAHGLAKSVSEQAHFLLSLSPMTWPHRLARVLLIEQLYRSHTLLNNHPYHH